MPSLFRSKPNESLHDQCKSLLTSLVVSCISKGKRYNYLCSKSVGNQTHLLHPLKISLLWSEKTTFTKSLVPFSFCVNVKRIKESFCAVFIEATLQTFLAQCFTLYKTQICPSSGRRGPPKKYTFLGKQRGGTCTFLRCLSSAFQHQKLRFKELFFFCVLDFSTDFSARCSYHDNWARRATT